MSISPRSVVCRLGFVALLFSAATVAMAETPWRRMSLFKQVDAEPGRTYTLTEENGPWMVMAYTFNGDDAETKANELVHELRSQHGMNAYAHHMQFNFDAGTSNLGVDRYGGPRKMKYRIQRAEEVAVLVGDFPAADDSQAQKALERLRSMQPNTLSKNPINENWAKDRTVKGWRALQQSFTRSSNNEPVGPMSHAFITSNPKIPEGYFKPKGIDKMVIDLNKPLKHSLLQCPGKYTVRVATFATPVIPYVANDKQKEEMAKKAVVGTLEEAADKAHRLCEALRAKNYEAYEFHDRYSSIVTIGSFDTVGTPRPDGKTEINPTIHKIMNTFGAEREQKPGQPLNVGKPKRMESIGVNFDIQPMPVEVPKRTIAADYQQY
ncbi:MAG: hypothetical protein JSS27_19595 [Planctomycetes bacterium]|nr:hypothetical protein [Planctomycetota bacterium]